MSRKKQRISTGGGESLTQNPFGALEGLEGLPAGPKDSPNVESSCAASAGAPEKTSKRGKKNTNRGRVDIIRQTAHRGGKAVTVVSNFPGIGLPEKKDLARKMQKACSVGGTVKEGRIEIQGDKREEVKSILIEAGFKPVFAGG
jgi:translation initiation factor 1